MPSSDIEITLIADELGKSLKNMAPQVQAELNAAVENLAHAAYSAMVAKVQGMGLDPKNRSDYLRALKFENLGDSTWLIHLEGDWANKLESGFGAYNIKDVLLKSDKIVEVGPRTGQPWVRTNKKGKKYAAVPFGHKPHSGENVDLGNQISQIMVKNRSGNMQSITKVFEDASGKAIAGKVATATAADLDHSVMAFERNDAKWKNLEGLTKYQNISDTGRVSSIYMTYRMVGEDSTGWVHPGHKGYNLFKEAEEYVNTELKNILNTLL
jgi:hypothetical protein